MIFDRTQEDIDKALLHRKKLQNGESVNNRDIYFILRGTLGRDELNEIEGEQKKLKELFNSMGYWNTPIENKTWDYTQIFDETEFQRIIDNTQILREAFFVYKDTPKTPPVSYHYEDINALEKILYDLGVMIDDVKRHYRKCGTFKCGS